MMKGWDCVLCMDLNKVNNILGLQYLLPLFVTSFICMLVAVSCFYVVFLFFDSRLDTTIQTITGMYLASSTRAHK